MEPMSILANLLLGVTAGTLMVALMAYAAYKMRERRRPKRCAEAEAEPAADCELIFMRPYRPQQATKNKRGVPVTTASNR